MICWVESLLMFLANFNSRVFSLSPKFTSIICLTLSDYVLSVVISLSNPETEACGDQQ